MVLISESHTELARRLHAEAAQVGLVLVDDSASWQSDSPRGVPERHAALGVLRIVSSSNIDLWLLPREGPPYHQVIQAQTEEGDPFAVRVIEEIRARLVELKLPAPEGPTAGVLVPEATSAGASPPRDPETHATVRVAAPWLLGLSGGVGATSAEGGMGATPQGMIALYAMRARLQATLEALLPLASNRFQAPEGTAKVDPYLLLLRLDTLVWRLNDVASISGGVGAGGLLLAMSGEGASGYVGKTDRSVVAVFGVDWDARVQLIGPLSLQGGFLVGSSAARPVARFDGHPVAMWGRLFITGAVGLELAFASASR